MFAAHCIDDMEDIFFHFDKNGDVGNIVGDESGDAALDDNHLPSI